MTNKEDAGSDRKYHSGYFPRRFVSFNQQIEAEQHSKAKTGTTEKETKNAWEKASIVITAAATVSIAISAIVTCVVAYWQWDALHSTDVNIGRQLEEMRKVYGPIETSAAAAKKSAEAAIATAPRARLYVELGTFPNDRAEVAYIQAPVGEGLRSFRVAVPIKIRNYGNLPALIKGVKAVLWVPNTIGIFDSPADLSKGVAGFSKAEEITILSQLIGQTVISEQTATPVFKPYFFFARQPDFGAHIEGLPKLLLVVVKYSDPAGNDRETSLYGRYEMGGIKFTIIANDKYTYWH